jgi:hypothetical protein
LAETKQVAKGYMYLHFPSGPHFIGRTGRFIPVIPSDGGVGGTLMRHFGGKEYAVAGTKGYYWVESDAAKARNIQLDIDLNYFERLVDEAKATIEKFGPFEEFVA